MYSDTELDRCAWDALAVAPYVPGSAVLARVCDGVVYLYGVVDWDYQSIAAERAVQGATCSEDGVHGVVNRIVVLPRLSPEAIRDNVFALLDRSSIVDASRLTVAVSGSVVILGGAVSSEEERAEAVRSAWQSPQVGNVRNHVFIENS